MDFKLYRSKKALKANVYLFFFILLPVLASSQTPIIVSDTELNFGVVSCYQTHSLSLTVQNDGASSVWLLAAEFEENVFSTDLVPIELAASGSRQFNVSFESSQNVSYSDFLRLNFDSGISSISIKVTAQATYENTYYSGTQNLWGSALKNALHNIIDDHTEYPYSSSSPDVWDMLKDADEDPENTDNVILLYTGWSYSKSDQNTGDIYGWNREHVWAKAHGDFGTSPPAGTDGHHLRPTDVTVNSARGSLDFDTGGSLYTDDDGATECRYDSDSWEPWDEAKGDVARMMYYMVIRYEGDDTSFDLELVDYTPSAPSGQPLFGKLSTLYQWHQNDPVSDWEKRRNERIYTNWQHNRNPFIDYPEFAARIPSISGVELIDEAELAVAPETVDMDQVGLNGTKEFKVVLLNTGTQDLAISSIVSTNPQFVLSASSFTIAPETASELVISFTEQNTEGTFNTIIQLSSNDSDEGYLEIPVTISVSGETSVVETVGNVHTFELQQNFPNPFNPSTKIPFQLPVKSHVRLAVFDVNGRMLEEPVNEELDSGPHVIAFHGTGLASGIYYYKLTVLSQTGQSIAKIRKMVFVR